MEIAVVRAGAAVRGRGEMSDPNFAAWLDPLSSSRPTGANLEALRALRGHEREQAIAALRRLGDDPDSAVMLRLEAAEAFVALDAPDQARDILLGIARAAALEPLEAATLVALLRRILSGAELLALAEERLATADLGIDLAASAADRGEPRAARALLLRFSRSDELVLDSRVKALLALAEVGRPRLVARELLSMVRGQVRTTAPRWATRANAFAALRQLRRERELIALAADERESLEVRVPAAESLWALNRADLGREYLLEIALDPSEGHFDHDIIGYAFEGRGMIKELVDLTREWGTSAAMRSMAIYVLDSRGHGELILDIARDPQAVPDARVVACRVLREQGRDDASAEILAALIRDRGLDVDEREAAAVALRGPERAETLIELALDTEVHPAARRSCMYGLVEVRDAEVAKKLGRLARSDPDPTIREAAGFAAGEIRVRVTADRWRRWTAPIRAALSRRHS
jgi:hypothetical protein